MRLPFRYQFLLAPAIIILLLAGLVAYTLIALPNATQSRLITAANFSPVDAMGWAPSLTMAAFVAGSLIDLTTASSLDLDPNEPGTI